MLKSVARLCCNGVTHIDANRRARTHPGMQAMWCGACTFKSCSLHSEVESRPLRLCCHWDSLLDLGPITQGGREGVMINEGRQPRLPPCGYQQSMLGGTQTPAVLG